MMNDKAKKVIGTGKCEEWTNLLEAALKKDNVSNSGIEKVIELARQCCKSNERCGNYTLSTDLVRVYLDWIEDKNKDDPDCSVLKRFIISLIRSHYNPDEAAVEKYGVDVFKHTCDEVSKWFEEHGDSQLASFVKVLDGDDKNTSVPM